MFDGPLPDARVDRWQLLDEVIGRWFRPGAEPVGVEEAALEAAERRLGLALPAALRELQLRLGLRREVWSVQDHLRAPWEWEVEAGALLIYDECQGAVRWGLGLDQLTLPDPPVQLDDRTGPSPRWTTECDRLSTFALASAARSAKFAGMPFRSANGRATEQACRAIERALPRLPLPDLRWPTAPTRLHGHQDLLVENNADTWLWVTARTQEAWEVVREIAAATGVTWEPSWDQERTANAEGLRSRG